jgi:hypothetical protein
MNLLQKRFSFIPLVILLAGALALTGCGTPVQGFFRDLFHDPKSAGGGDPIWTAVTTSQFDTTTIYGIAYGNNKFVAVGDLGKMAYSSNGEDWAAVGDSKFNSSDHIYGIAYGGGKFVAVGYPGKMAYSSNGEDWMAVGDSTFNSSDWINGIAYGGGKFVAGGGYGKMAHS